MTSRADSSSLLFQAALENSPHRCWQLQELAQLKRSAFSGHLQETANGEKVEKTVLRSPSLKFSSPCPYHTELCF